MPARRATTVAATAVSSRAAAARRWHDLVAHWPILEREWVRVAESVGWRPPPDVLVAMLRRARRSALELVPVLHFGGPLAAWLVDQLPELAAGRPAGREDSTADAELAVPTELRAGFDLAPDDFAAVIATGMLDGVFRWAHRQVLVNTVAAMPANGLPALLAALDEGRAAQERRVAQGGQPAVPLGLWESLIELADVRRSMLIELEAPRA